MVLGGRDYKGASNGIDRMVWSAWYIVYGIWYILLEVQGRYSHITWGLAGSRDGVSSSV